MNFDQKAVKFLANFYINGGKHWTHGPLSQKLPRPPQSQSAVLWLGPRPGAAWEEAWPSQKQAVAAAPGLGVDTACAATLRKLLLERRPPLLTDPEVPGPAKYQVPSASARESSAHPHYSLGRRHPGPEGGGRRAWQTEWLRSESPFTHKVDFNRELKWPSPAHYRPLSGPAARSCSARVPLPAAMAPEGQARPARPRAHPLVQALARARGEKRPDPGTYDVVPGHRLRSPRAPAFSMGRARAPASRAGPAGVPGPGAYRTERARDSRFRSAPGALIQGVRRPKRHDTGPFCAL
ncbi:protein STPG3 isoform X1 [Lepus europaeus]|uniref:protein STPG3 isoform X1 n=1 Tax=Lepus europaeus TaxID=9983 RepID=UPI002B466E9E|nr:protein STPG3 isoform X1 [Lepus europaeus]